MSKLINQVDIIRRSCPSCTVNAKKYFCNLFCLPNQNEIVNIEKKIRQSVVNVSYVVSEKFAQTFFESCRDVKIFGANLMDQDFICGPHKREGCDVHKFLTTLGSISQMPLVIRPIITDTSLVTIMGNEYVPMTGEVYHCYEAPPNEEKCSCDNCKKRCNETIALTRVVQRDNNVNPALTAHSNQCLVFAVIASVLAIRSLF